MTCYINERIAASYRLRIVCRCSRWMRPRCEWGSLSRSVVEAAAWLGHSPQEHLRTYVHATLADRSELDYAKLLGRSQIVTTR